VGRKSSITRLPPKVKKAVDAAIRDGRATIDEIVEQIESMGATASRSAVHRYKKTLEEHFQRVREARELSKVWIDKLGSEPDSDVGQLVAELLKTVAVQTSMHMNESDEAVPPNQLMFLAKAMKEIAQAEKLSLEREIKIREQVASEAADAVEEAAATAGLSSDVVKLMKEKVLGIR